MGEGEGQGHAVEVRLLEKKKKVRGSLEGKESRVMGENDLSMNTQ